MRSQLRALLGTWPGRFIVLVMLSQLLLPLHYYVARRDPHDERFAWRMFSPMRMARCTPRFVVDGAPLPLGSAFHEAWIEIASRGRFAVIEQMGAKLCAAQPARSVNVFLDCTYVDRADRAYGGYDMCKAPLL
ncbi:MAG: hypothetical protein M3680_36265 [Myxococcota bacterium]|nr:hypothetical protein [Myxococcota bacterium]